MFEKEGGGEREGGKEEKRGEYILRERGGEEYLKGKGKTSFNVRLPQ